MRFPWQDRSPERQQEAIQDLFLKVFSTPEGMQCVTIILEDLKHFDPVKTEGEKALSEYAKFFISERLGLGDSYAITEALLGLAQKNRRSCVTRSIK